MISAIYCFILFWYIYIYFDITSLELSVLVESIVNPYKMIAAGLGAEGSFSAAFTADYFLETSPNNFQLKFIPGKKDRVSIAQ